MPIKRNAGFTLLEVLIALFIFTILSMMMVGALHSVITSQEGTERSAERLRALQLVLVRVSRDVEQTVNRPVRLANGSESPAFFGTARGFVFTHGGSSQQSSQHQGLQRTQYIWNESSLWRMVWNVLDQAANSKKPSQRMVMENITDAQFEFLDDKGAFHAEWPAAGMSNQPLPRAVRMSLIIKDWGTIRQIYVIPAQASPAAAAPAVTPPPP